MTEVKPLTGLRVVEMGSLLAGPFAGMLMAQYGAEVIKIEPPHGDQIRTWRQQHNGTSLWWYSLNRNKKSVALDLRDARAQDLMKKLLSDADVLLENFRPGTLEKWGLGWDSLHDLNDRLIMVRVSGYGQTGPYKDRAGFGAIGEAMGGIRHITGYEDRPPVRVGSPLGDTMAAMFAFGGAMAAVYARDSSGLGKGQLVDVALYEAVFAMTDSMLPEYDYSGNVRGRTGARMAGISPSNTYECKCGRHLVIGGNNDSIFKRLMKAIGRPELAEDPRFTTNQKRVEHEVELDELLSAWSSSYTVDEALAVLDAASVPAGPIYTIADIVKDPQYRARDMIEEVDLPGFGPLKIPGIVPKFSEHELQTQWVGPELGQHTREVLSSLQIEEDELLLLKKRGVTTWPQHH